jgi:hypothetical protein
LTLASLGNAEHGIYMRDLAVLRVHHLTDWGNIPNVLMLTLMVHYPATELPCVWNLSPEKDARSVEF